MSLSLPRLGPRPFLDERRRALEARSWEHFDARPVAPVLGAEVSGVALGDRLSDDVIAELRDALITYKVLFFRDQPITSEQQLAFAARFGPLEEHPFIPAAEESPEIVRFEKSQEVVGVENIWHSDVSWREVPSLGSVLRARDVPDLGGDTLFSDMEAAYDGLDDETRERIDGLVAVHDFVNSFGAAMSREKREAFSAQYPPVEHPVVRTHPETGRRSIYVNAVFTSHIVGLPSEESDALLDRLYRQAAVPEYQCRFRWAVDSVAFWDNRSVQHYAANDYWPRRRVMDRVTIIGDRPR